MQDVNDFVPIFKAETDDHLTNLDKGLVELEKHPDDKELIEELYREAHTLKGTARVFGFYEIQEIAHKIEDIFDKSLKVILLTSSSIISNPLRKAVTNSLFMDNSPLRIF